MSLGKGYITHVTTALQTSGSNLKVSKYMPGKVHSSLALCKKLSHSYITENVSVIKVKMPDVPAHNC